MKLSCPHLNTRPIKIICLDVFDLCAGNFGLLLQYSFQTSRLSGLFLWSQFGDEYLLVTIKIRSYILFKTTALKGAVKCESFCSRRAKAVLALVATN